ncbi:MAG: ROK family protein, partial [Acidimicrobiia bacterium]|nr:ROK family protein [Acidimicrobiia bacterium]
EALDQAGRWLGRGVATIIDILSPSVVVLGGGLGNVTRRLIGPAREVIAGIDRYRYRTEVEIRPSDLGEFAGAHGAALQVRD